MKTKNIIVLSTLINAHENYVAGGLSRHGMYPNKWLVAHTTDLRGAAIEFESLQEAEEFIPSMYNPHNRIYTPVTRTIEFHSKKEEKAYERIS